MTHPSDHPPGDDRFLVECPECGREVGSYSQAMTRATRHCSCGTVFKIDLENQCAGERIE